ncbi:MAG: hypothetical protein OFPI_10690 [Osedax symbiont Rs2]|nr:MAG: hypothetical protein OFPI_10690 [Osedax symbiont Rs2]
MTVTAMQVFVKRDIQADFISPDYTKRPTACQRNRQAWL